MSAAADDRCRRRRHQGDPGWGRACRGAGLAGMGGVARPSALATRSVDQGIAGRRSGSAQDDQLGGAVSGRPRPGAARVRRCVSAAARCAGGAGRRRHPPEAPGAARPPAPTTSPSSGAGTMPRPHPPSWGSAEGSATVRPAREVCLGVVGCAAGATAMANARTDSIRKRAIATGLLTSPTSRGASHEHAASAIRDERVPPRPGGDERWPALGPGCGRPHDASARPTAPPRGAGKIADGRRSDPRYGLDPVVATGCIKAALRPGPGCRAEGAPHDRSGSCGSDAPDSRDCEGPSLQDEGHGLQDQGHGRPDRDRFGLGRTVRSAGAGPANARKRFA